MIYKPDYRLVDAYEEATELNDKGLAGLCPSYIELAGEGARYRDEELLGKGAVKEVYKTFNNHTRRWIAMARLRADRGAEFYDLFVHEAWLTASLSHPNIITVHDAGIDETGRPFFTMDLKGESTLADRATGSNPAGRRELLDVFLKVCDAVAYAHSQGIIHLDLKPENIQANKFGEVLVCDWGLAKIIGAMEEGEYEIPAALKPIENMTLVGEIKGSLGYMAPEQVVPGSVKDPRSDVFSLGCLLHLILTGHPPFTGTQDEIIEATKVADFAPPRNRYPERHIPAALEAVVLKATALAPAGRYASVQELRHEISNFLGGYSTLAEHPGFFREARLFLGRNRLPASIALIAMVTISELMVFSFQNIRRHRDRAAEFETQVETVEILYQDELERSEDERMMLANKLAASASDLKKLSIYFRPIETVREARKLVASAFALNAESSNARLQRFSLHCITLNFKEARIYPVEPQSGLADYLLFAQAFPQFDFSEERRPSVGILASFLVRAGQLNPTRKALMERIVAYDYAARIDTAGYAPVVEALLQYINESQEDFSMEYDASTSILHVRANQSIRLTIWDTWGSNRCLLRFLAFRTLKVDMGGALFFPATSSTSPSKPSTSGAAKPSSSTIPSICRCCVGSLFIPAKSILKRCAIPSIQTRASRSSNNAESV
ncbi:MAG: serine/threonine-protein kinase [Pontiella sp.]